MWHRLKPALTLVALAPLIAEYLLGSLSFAQMVLFPIMALIYGGGALFIRETARRSGRGWGTIFALGFAYALVEEGLATQSLFNPHYLGLRLLDYGFVPAWGIGAPWTVYVLVLHVVWSIAVPIAFVEALFSERRETPWLGRGGFIVSGVVYLLGVAMVTFGTWKKEKFVASPTQLGVCAVLAVVCVIVAFAAFRRGGVARVREDEGTRARLPGRMAGICALGLGTGSIFHLLTQFGSSVLSPTVAVVLALALPLAVIGVVRWIAARDGWTVASTDALMIGGLLAYCWLGFFLAARLHGRAAIPGQIFPCAIVLGLAWWRFGRARAKGA